MRALQGHTLLARIAGADAAALTAALATHAREVFVAQSKTDQAPAAPTEDAVAVGMAGEETPEQLEGRMRGLMNKGKVVLFMKGTPDAPRCGFSRQTVAILQEQGVAFEHFDILSDESVRQGEWGCIIVDGKAYSSGFFLTGLKVLNDWPTFPQIIVNGEFVGGLDVLKEAVGSGEFKELVTS